MSPLKSFRRAPGPSRNNRSHAQTPRGEVCPPSSALPPGSYHFAMGALENESPAKRLGVRFRRRLRRALKPGLAPPAIDRAGTEQAKVTEPGAAPHALEDDGRGLHLAHDAGLLVDELLDLRQYAIDSAGIGDHLGVIVEAAVLVLPVERGEDLLVRLHPHQFARLQPEFRNRCVRGVLQ